VTNISAPDRYHVAVFLPDGSLEGTAVRERARLSAKWLGVGAELLAQDSASGRVVVPYENLDHLDVRFTRSDGAALVSYHAVGDLAVSSLLLTGENPVVEAEVIDMFLASVRRSGPVQGVGTVAPFGKLLSLRERPLHAVVVWGNPRVSDDDAQLIQELSAHVAGAFLTA
jgi:hypothetical protein